MATLLDIRRRIRSVKSTQQITKAMKMVAAARLRRSQERVFSARPYAREMRAVLESLAARAEMKEHPLLRERPEERILLLVLTGDKGLCGAFNANILRLAQHFLEEHRQKELLLVPVGKKGRDFYRKRPVKIVAEYVQIFSKLDFLSAREIARRVMELYTGEAVDAVHLVYNEFKTILTQRLVSERLLPIERFGPSQAVAVAERPVDYIYEQPAEATFDVLLPKYVEIQVFRALLESAAAEQAARMTAMDSATKNAAEMIDDLTLNMNRVRQAKITREIIEIVSGAAAL